MGDPFRRLTAVALPLMRDNVNTDAIIPSREIKSVSKSGLSDGLFADWRYTQVGGRELDPSFILNDPLFAGAQILLAGLNFGCGSSREHAAWALREYGFRAIVAASFNPIFQANAVLNGIVPVVLPHKFVAAIAGAMTHDARSAKVTVDLDDMVVVGPGGEEIAFELDSEARIMLRDGIDTIGLTLKHLNAIKAFRRQDAQIRPWAYPR